MPDPLVVSADVERVLIEYLNLVLPQRSEAYALGATAALEVPPTWKHKVDKPFVTVSLDGTPVIEYPVVEWPSIRATAHGLDPSPTKALARLVQALLCSRHGDGRVNKISPLTGVLPAKDPDSGAAMASITVRAATRLQLL